jgi:16S rRNA (adenine1518-N6/adenine1519-N6)-dimethyltransferase
VAAPAARPDVRRDPSGGAITPRKRFGQHFLHDPGVLARIVAAVAPSRDECIVEIGPGEGALTRALLERVPHLSAIEIDRDLAARLGAEFPPDRLTVYCADALEFPFQECPQGLRVVGNLPYNISTPLLFHLAGFADRVRDMHFMLQREVVERMVARPSTPEYGRLSVMLQARFAMRKLFRVAPGAFRPPPRVESALVRMLPLEEKMDCDEAVFEKLVRQAFSARRKTLRNALPGMDLAALGIDPKLRPENLSPGDYLRISRGPPGVRGGSI